MYVHLLFIRTILKTTILLKKNYITSSFKWMTYFSLLNSIALEITSCGGTYRVVNMSVHECLHVFVYTCMRWGFLCMVDEFYSV